MAAWNDPRSTQSGFGASTNLHGNAASNVAFDAGLRRHMLSIYNYMTSAVLLSGIVALLFASSGMAATVLMSPLRWLIILSPLAIVFAMSFGATKFSAGTLKMMFWGF